MEHLVQRAVNRPYDIPLNVAVWMAFKPLLKIYLSIGTGFVLAKTKVLTPQITKGISRLILLIFMPALLFNNIVTNIKDTDIKLFGVVIFSGFIYYTIGLGYGFLVRLVAPIPRAWFGGLLLCTMLNNCSDLPLAYVQAIGQTPFLPSNLASVGQSYCVLIVIVFVIFLFNLGGSRLVEWDATRVDPRRDEPTVPLLSLDFVKGLIRKARYRNRHGGSKHKHDSLDESLEKELSHDDEQGPLGSDNHFAEAETSSPAQTAGIYVSKVNSTETKHSSDSVDEEGDEDGQERVRELDAANSTYLFARGYDMDDVHHTAMDSTESLDPTTDAGQREIFLRRIVTDQSQHRARQERHFGGTDVYYSTRRRDSTTTDLFVDAPINLTSMEDDAPLAFQNLNTRINAQASRHSRPIDSQSIGQESMANSEVPNTRWQRFRHSWFKAKEKNVVVMYLLNFLEDMTLPQMLALISGITVAMIPWVRRVFVKGQNIHHFHDAPDHMPPLDFLMEFLSFFAGAQVPLGLMLLGATIASLKVGKMVKGFWKAVVLIAIFKLALLPIIACAWINRIRAIGWIEMDDVMTPIVLAVAAATPSATVQIYLTLAWIDPTKESLELNSLAINLLAQYLFLPITLTFLMTYVIMHYV